MDIADLRPSLAGADGKSQEVAAKMVERALIVNIPGTIRRHLQKGLRSLWISFAFQVLNVVCIVGRNCQVNFVAILRQ